MEIQSKKLIGSDRYRFGDRQLLIGIGIGSADQEKLLIGRSLFMIFNHECKSLILTSKSEQAY